MGVAEFKASAHVAADRCSSWMDGGMLQTTFLPGHGKNRKDVPEALRVLNDSRPDVVIATAKGLDGFAAPRGLTETINLAMGDGSVRHVKADSMSAAGWYNLVHLTDPPPPEPPDW